MNYSEQRPWGGYTVLLTAPTHQVKQMVINPGQRLSYQRHQKRHEHWYIVSGQGVVTLNDKERPVGPGDTVEVAVGDKHRIACTGSIPLCFIEVQTGSYFGEDDIERLHDDYGRTGKE